MGLFRKKKRILFAAVDIGFRIEHYSEFIRKEFNDELEAESFSKYKLPASHYETSFTYLCDITKERKMVVYWKTGCFFLKSLFRYDILHFLSGETILPWKLRGFELACYRLLGKRIIMHFVGSDIRSEKYLEEKNEHLKEYLKGEYQIKHPISEGFQIKLITTTRKYAHHILVSTPDLLDIVPEGTFVPVFLNLEKHESIKTKNTSIPLKILHSPSAFNTKGSNYIHEVLTDLQEIFSDKIEVITPGKRLNKGETYSLSRYELLDLLKDTDIVIDQMLIGWYGLKSVEALNAGCEVFCFIEPNLIKYLGAANPIHTASILDLKESLIQLIHQLLLDPDSAARLKEKTSFVQSHHELKSKKTLLRKIWLN